MPSYWLIKSEPDAYGWDDLEAEKEGTWDGVRNHAAKKNLQAMEVGDQCFFYHSRQGLEIIGICEVSVAGIADPTDETGQWAAVKVVPKTKLPSAVSLKQIKAEPALADMQLVRQSRLSVSRVEPTEWSLILSMAGI